MNDLATTNGHVRAVTPALVPLIKGRPTKAAEDRRRTGTWGYSGMLPRTIYRDYKAREGRTVFETLRVLRDRDPDAAQAVNTLLLLCLQGYQITAEVEDGVQDDEGTALLRDQDARVGAEYGGGADQLLGVYLLSLITDGGMCGELELAPDLRSIVDAHPVAPAKVTFQREEKTDRLMLGIGSGKEFVELNPRQVRYVPWQPDVGDPYGRPMLLAAIAPIFAKIEFLEDLRDVLHHQAWPRLDVEVVEQAIVATLPESMPYDKKAAIVSDTFTAIQTGLLAMDPTQNPIHLDSIKLKALEVANGLPDLKAVMDLLDSQIVTGLKTLNVFLNRNAGSTTTHATVQARVFALEVQAIQRTLKRFWEWVGTTALQLAGRQSRAHVEFELLQTTDRVMDANARATETATWVTMVQQGWADADEAANDLLGHDAVDEPAPEPEPVIEDEVEEDEPAPDDTEQERQRIVRPATRATDEDALIDDAILKEAAALFREHQQDADDES